MSGPKWLKKIEEPLLDNGSYFSLQDAREKFEVRELIKDHAWLVLKRVSDEESVFLDFAVLEFATQVVGNEEVECQVVFHGHGLSGALRECRHTWWGEEGYLYYVNGPTITAAFRALSEFFDEMT